MGFPLCVWEQQELLLQIWRTVSVSDESHEQLAGNKPDPSGATLLLEK